MHLWIRDQMKNLHFFGILHFHRFLKTSAFIFVKFSWSKLRIAFLTNGTEKNPFVLRFHNGRSWPLFSIGFVSTLLISLHCWISKLRKGLLGWKFQFAEIEFQASFTDPFCIVDRANNLGLRLLQMPFQKERFSPLLISFDLWIKPVHPFDNVCPRSFLWAILCKSQNLLDERLRIFCKDNSLPQGIMFNMESPKPFT